MSVLPTKLSNKCTVCNNSEFIEDEFGCLACTECGIVNKNFQEVKLEYEDINRFARKKTKMNFDEEGVDIEMQENNDHEEEEYTNCNTSVNINDTESKVSDHNPNEKSMNDIFLDHQEIFIKLTKIFYNCFKKLTYFKILQIDDRNDIVIDSLGTNVTLPFSQDLQFNFQNNNISLDDDLKNIFEISKIIWFNLIQKEFDIQSNKLNPMKKRFRSRKNTEEIRTEPGRSDKKKKFKEELLKRQIKEKNIINMCDFKGSDLRNREKVKKFIDEYDQVRIDLNLEQFNFKNMSMKYNLKENFTFEETIHKYFREKNLDYKALHSEIKFDELKSNFNSDHILSLFYIIFSSANKVILMKDFLNMFTSFDLMVDNSKINFNELKMMKYANKEQFSKLLEKHQKQFSIKFSPSDIFIKVCNQIKMPKVFSDLCIKLYLIIEKNINKHINHNYTLESFKISIILYLIKLLYGLNDLSYLISLNNDMPNLNDQTNDFMVTLNRALKLLDIFGPNDSFFNMKKELPTLQHLLKNISNLIKEDNENHAIWDGIEFKKNYNSNYKDKLKNFSNKIWFAQEENKFFVNKANEVEKKLKQYNKDNALQNKIEIDKKVQNTKVKFSNKFTDKLSQKHELKEVKFNTFLQEEIDFYEELSSFKNGKISKNLEIPLPCDNILNFDRKAYKFEGITPPESELIIYYYFKYYFKIDYNVLRKCNKIIEKYVSEKLF